MASGALSDMDNAAFSRARAASRDTADRSSGVASVPCGFRRANALATSL